MIKDERYILDEESILTIMKLRTNIINTVESRLYQNYINLWKSQCYINSSSKIGRMNKQIKLHVRKEFQRI